LTIVAAYTEGARGLAAWWRMAEDKAAARPDADVREEADESGPG